MALAWIASLLFILFSLKSLLCLAETGCPLDFNSVDFSKVVTACNSPDRAKCCRFVNAVVAISMSQYTNVTSQLAVPPYTSDKCLRSISDILLENGLPSNVSIFCGLGTKIAANFNCKGRANILEMEGTPKFKDVQLNCVQELLVPENCRKCLNASFTFLHNLEGPKDNVTLSLCRAAIFVTVASYGDPDFASDKAGCFFNVRGLYTPKSSRPKVLAPAPTPTKAVLPGQSPEHPPTSSDHSKAALVRKPHSRPKLPVILGVGIGTTVLLLFALLVLVLLIQRKRRELTETDDTGHAQWKSAISPRTSKKLQEWKNGPPSSFRRFSCKEIRIATDDFSTIIGRGGFGTVYKARFKGGLVAAVKRMNKIAKIDEFCKEMELFGRLHHRHLVTLIGFCAEQHERFLIYEYMENGSLKEHLLVPAQNVLKWQTRVQIAIDVAAALEYLHFYCDPPLCHRDIKASNILLDENFVAKVADFGLAHVAPLGASNFEPVNTDVRGTPGYMDPEYLITQELTEKSDVYSYGVLLLEIITARQAVQDNQNLVEWAQRFILEDCNLSEMVDPNLGDLYDYEQLRSLVSVVRMCTQREGRLRPSIRQVLQLLYDRLDITCPNSAIIAADSEDESNSVTVTSKGKVQIYSFINGNSALSGEVRCVDSSSPNTSRSYCSKSFLLEHVSSDSEQ